jgi:DNA-binding MarR family transcriptional regulator
MAVRAANLAFANLRLHERMFPAVVDETGPIRRLSFAQARKLAATRSDKTTKVDACDQVARGLPSGKREAWVGFMKSHAALTRALDADLIANVGIPLSAFTVLFAIGYTEEGLLRMSDVAEEARLSPSRVSRLVTELEQRGLLERRTCESDSRVVYAAITDDGRALLADCEDLHFDGVERRFFSALSDDEIAQLAELWPRVLEATGSIDS